MGKPTRRVPSDSPISVVFLFLILVMKNKKTRGIRPLREVVGLLAALLVGAMFRG